jgi:hypothetical protein
MEARPPDGRVNWYHAASVVLVVGFVNAALPSLSRRAEPWYETGSNFLTRAYHDGWWDNLWATDSGYLPWLARLVAVFTVKVLGCVKYYPVVAQELGVLAAALLASHVNLRCFRPLIPDDRVRFVLGAALGCGAVCADGLYTLHNVAYFGVPLLALVAALDPRRMTRGEFLAHLPVVPLLFLSKALLLPFAPVFAVRFLAGVRPVSPRHLLLYGAGLLAAAGQAYTVYQFHKQGTLPPPAGVGFVVREPVTFAAEVRDVYANTVPFVLVRQPAPDAQVQIAVFLAAAVAGLIVAAARRGEWGVLRLAAVCGLVSVGVTAMQVIARCAWTPPLVGYQHAMSPTNQLLFAALVALAGTVPRTAGTRVAAAGLLALVAAGRRAEPFFDRHADRADSPSHWRAYWHLLRDDQYAIPCTAYPWMMLRNCVPLHGPDLFTFDGCRADLAATAPIVPWWSVKAVTWECDPPHRANPPAALVAVDAAGAEVGRAARLSKPGHRYQYFVFPKPAAGFHAWKFVDAAGNPVPVTARNVMLWGNPPPPPPGG